MVIYLVKLVSRQLLHSHHRLVPNIPAVVLWFSGNIVGDIHEPA